MGQLNKEKKEKHSCLPQTSHNKRTKAKKPLRKVAKEKGKF
jgi:hypothetical protein